MTTTTFAQALSNAFTAKQQPATTLTENGAVAYASTGSKLLDLFSQAGALRLGRGAANAIDLFIDAFREDNLLATKALFYFRDVRGGQGERETFRVFLRVLAENAPSVVRKNLSLIPEYGRWDDLFTLVGTEHEDEMFAFLRDRFTSDLQTDRPSLLGKWLPSENTSSKKTRALAKKTRLAFGISPKAYRQGLSALRAQIKVVERLISANQWSKVEYSAVPSMANLKYRKAFARHDQARFTAFHTRVEKGLEKVNASVQFPYQIVEKVMSTYNMDSTERLALNNMWNAQPDYIGTSDNSIVVADVSGSMSGTPLNVSISLALYAAERNTGPYHNKFMTFSSHPQLVSVTGTDLVEKCQNINRADWEMNTNIEAVFDTLLHVAVANKLSSDEVVKRIFIVSDMEFDGATSSSHWASKNRVPEMNKTLFADIRARWENAGYQLPVLVFWNVRAANSQSPMNVDDRGFISVSGCSPSIFKNVMKGNITTPIDMMLDVLNSSRYDAITV